VFGSRRKIIFVHGCFWHKHKCIRGRRSPATNRGYWNLKRERNVQRDSENIRALRAAHWAVFVVWECWTRDTTRLAKRLSDFLG
jgi:DNA mismatch endonuclease (patch repair protein)